MQKLDNTKEQIISEIYSEIKLKLKLSECKLIDISQESLKTQELMPDEISKKLITISSLNLSHLFFNIVCYTDPKASDSFYISIICFTLPTYGYFPNVNKKEFKLPDSKIESIKLILEFLKELIFECTM